MLLVQLTSGKEYFGVSKNVRLCDKSDIEMVRHVRAVITHDDSCHSSHFTHSHSDLCQQIRANDTSAVYDDDNIVLMMYGKIIFRCDFKTFLD